MRSRINDQSRRLYFDIYSDSFLTGGPSPAIPHERIEDLRTTGINSILCLFSRQEDLSFYRSFREAYGREGFEVDCMHIERLTPDYFPDIKKAVEKIYFQTKVKNNTCLVLSFNSIKHILIISAALLIYKGNSPEETISVLSRNMYVAPEEGSFIHGFAYYMSSGKRAQNPLQSAPEAPGKTSAGTGPAAATRPTAGKEDTRPAQAKPSTKPEPKETQAETLRGKTVKAPEAAPTSVPLAPTEKKTTAEAPVSEEAAQFPAGMPQPESIPAKTPGRRKHEREAAKSAEVKAAPPEKPAHVAEKTSPVPDRRGSRVRTSIRFKLISIVSLIIVFSLAGMIFLASYFFRSDNELRVQETNHRLSQVIALKVETDFNSIVEKARLMATTMAEEPRWENRRQAITGIFFNNDRDFISLGIGERQKRGIVCARSIANSEFMGEIQMKEDDLAAVNAQYSDTMGRSFEGKPVVFNASQGFKIPAMGMAIPFERGSDKTVRSIIIVYMKLDRFLQAFRSSGITDTFMVNEQGDVIAHPDGRVVLAQSNYLDLPIVNLMMKSRLDNGQTRYISPGGVPFLGSFKRITFAGIGIIATVSEHKAFKEVYRIQRRNIYIMIIVLNIAVLIVYFFGKSLSSPIQRLVGATRRIERGEFLVDIRPTSNDEIGDLTKSFIAMGKGLEEREKMKDAFGKFVNKEIAEMVLRDEIRLGGERKMTAIFFSDIRSFTAISEKLEPEEVVEFLNEYMTKMVRCVNQTHGVVDKFIGDAIMAVWGTPVSRGNDVQNAIDCALMMRGVLVEHNRERGTEKKPAIKIGCGIAWGPVLAGQIGSEDRMEYTVIGDTVNLASRIEALNKPLGTDILISQEAYEAVKDVFTVEKMQMIKVKGKVEAQQIYAVLGRKDDTSRPKTLGELRSRLGIVMSETSKGDADEEVKYEILNK